GLGGPRGGNLTARLFRRRRRRISAAMPFRPSLAVRWLGLSAPAILAPTILLSLAPPPAAAAPKHHAPAKEAPSTAKQLGKFDDWTAVTREEGGQTVCYAFTYPTTSVPKLSGRGKPVLTVTERSSGRDAVAFSAGFAFAANAETNLQVEQTSLPFYTAGRFAFACASEIGTKPLPSSP
ncbi:MAG: hypothetical protein J0H30_08620, partial [Alphaproteobacteria bacterium]|nr:hypothetical protein [Alphaproteobacteria bacterium]